MVVPEWVRHCCGSELHTHLHTTARTLPSLAWQHSTTRAFSERIPWLLLSSRAQQDKIVLDVFWMKCLNWPSTFHITDDRDGCLPGNQVATADFFSGGWEWFNSDCSSDVCWPASMAQHTVHTPKVTYTWIRKVRTSSPEVPCTGDTHLSKSQVYVRGTWLWPTMTSNLPLLGILFSLLTTTAGPWWQLEPNRSEWCVAMLWQCRVRRSLQLKRHLVCVSPAWSLWSRRFERFPQFSLFIF